MSQYHSRLLNGLLTLICLVSLVISATTQTAYAQDDNDPPPPATPEGGGGGTGGATGNNTTSTTTTPNNQAPAAPTRPSNRTLLVNAFRLPICEETITNQPLVPSFQPGQQVRYSWNLKPPDATRDELYLFDLNQTQFDLLLFQLSSNNTIFDFGWNRNLRIIRGSAGETPRSGFATVNPFTLNNRPASMNWFVVFRDANGNPLCRTRNNNWLRTNLDAQGQPQLCGASDLGLILQPCSGQGTQVAQTTGTGTGGTGTGTGGSGGGGGPVIPPADSDGDGVPDGADLCPGTPAATPVNAQGCPLNDLDQDGVPNAGDLCPGTPIGAPVNANGCPDTDGDTFFDDVDLCPATPGVGPNGCPPAGICGDSIVGNSPGEECDPPGGTCTALCRIDTDGDTFPDSTDNCPTIANNPQTNTDGAADGGDACDPDDDNDGFNDLGDSCPLVPGVAMGVPGPGCPIGVCGNGIVEAPEACDAGAPNGSIGGADACAAGCLADPDNDEVGNPADNCPTVSNPGQLDTDGDLIGDACDTLPFGCILDPHVVRMDGTAAGFEEDFVGDFFLIANQQCPDRANNIFGNANSNVIEGTNFGDIIDGAANNDVLSGRGGNDTITGGAGDDVIRGGDNTSDTATGDVFDESAFGGNMTVTLNATTGPSGYTGLATGNGNDALFGIENVFTGGGNDSFLLRAPINNLIDGNGGTDTATVDRLTGSGTITIRRGASGTGPDVTVTGTGIGTDSLNDIEQVNVTGNATAVNYFDIRDNQDNELVGGSNLDTYDMTNTNTFDSQVDQTAANDFTVTNSAGVDTLTNFEQVFTNNGDDTFNITQPNTGFNTYDARGNSAPAVAGQGDLYNNTNLTDLVFGIDSTGSGTVSDGGATDSFLNFEHFTTAGGNDRFNIADSRTNRLDAGAGQDTYDASTGSNLTVTQTAANNFTVAGSGGFGTDTLTGFEEVYSDSGNDTFTIAFANTGVNVYDAGGNGTPGDLYNNTSGNNIQVLIGTGGSGTIDDGAQDLVFNFENFSTNGGADFFEINDSRGNILDANAGTDTYNLSGFIGTNSVLISGTGGVITATGSPIGTDTLNDFEIYTAGGGADTFRFDGVTTVPGGSTFEGGAGIDLYQFTGTGNTTVFHNTTSATNSNGTITDGVNTDAFADIENFTTGGGNDSFFITAVGVAQNNTFNAGGNGTAGDTYNNATNENLTVNLVDGTGTAVGTVTGTDSLIDFENLFTGSGADTITITTPTESFGIIDSGGGADSVSVTDSGNNSIQGGAGVDTLNLVFEVGGAATVNASGLATLGVNPNETTGTPLGNDTLFGFETLNVTGTSGNDSLTLIDDDANLVDMLTGTDLVTIGLADSGGDDTVTVTRTGNNVAITDGGAGATGNDSVNNTEQVNLIGSTQSNRFVMNDSSSNVVDGATNDPTGDTYDAGAATTAVTANLNGANTGAVTGTFTGNDTIVNIENLITGSANDTVNLTDVGINSVNTGGGTADVGNVSLFDTGGTNEVTITRSGAGFQGSDVTLNDLNNNTTGDDSFSNIERLNFTGTDDDDDFIVNDNLANTIAGGAGSDLYDVSGSTTMDLSVTYNLAGNVTVSRTAAGPDFVTDTLSSIEEVATGSGDDFFIIEQLGNYSFDANGNNVGPGDGDLFNYTGAGNMTLTYDGVTGTGTAATSGIGVTSLADFELFAGDAGNDVFNFNDTQGRNLSGEEGSDTYNFTGTGNLTVGVGDPGANPEEITVDDVGGVADEDTLIGFESFNFTTTGSVTFDIYLERIASKVGAPIRLDATNATLGGVFNFIGSALDVDRDAGANDPDDFRDIEIVVGSAIDRLNFTAVTNAGISALDLSNSGFQTIFGLGSNVRIRLIGTMDNVDGTDQNDNITGNSTANVINTGLGNDRVSGGAGDDSIDTGGGTDTLTGGAGNDTLIGGNQAGDLLEEGTNTGNLTVDLDTVAGSMQDGTFTDDLQGINNVNTGSGNDSVTGNNNGNAINTGNGADTVDALAGADSINTGLGDDSVLGGDGNDTVLAGDGNDTVEGGNDNDTIQGDLGNDSLDGGAGSDTVQGGAGVDTLYGGAGNDRVDGQEGADTIFGGSNNLGIADGSDTINDSGSDGGDAIYGGNAGSGDDLGDLITLGTATNGRTVYGGNQNSTGNGNDGSDTIAIDGSSFNTVYGGNENSGGDGNDQGDKIDVINGTNNTIFGGNNNTGGNGDDAGIDSIYSNTGFSSLYGGNSNDGGNGNDAGDRIVNDGNNATVYGGNYNQNGGVGNDNGTDTLTILSNNTNVFGDNQNQGGEGLGGNDAIEDFSGSDTSGGNNTFYGGNSNQGAACANLGADCADGSDTMDIYSNTNLIYGGNLNTSGGDGNDVDDTVTLNSGNNTLYGGNNNNSNGSTGSDQSDTLTINVGPTNPNTVYGGNRNNSTSCTGLLCDDIGGDTISDFSSGSDAIFGGNQNQAGNGDDGADSITLGGLGSGTGATVYGGNTNSGTGNGSDQGDTLTDTSGQNDTIFGGNRNAGTCTGLTCQDGGDTITLSDTGSNSVVGGNNNVSGCSGTGCDDTGNNSITDLSTTGIDTIYVGNANSGGAGSLGGSNTVTSTDGGTDTVCPGNKGNGTLTGATTVEVNNDVAQGGNSTVTGAGTINPCP
jgi:Ca2+-binding RTX toxin-like protein